MRHKNWIGQPGRLARLGALGAAFSVILFVLVGCQPPMLSEEPAQPLASAAGQQPLPLSATPNQMAGEQIAKTLASLRKVDDHPLYTMTYYGDYDLELPANVEPTALQGVQPWACSLFAAFADPNAAIYGRNFDWEDNPALLLFTDPTDGYASVSMVDILYLGFDHDNLSALDTVEGREPLLRAPLLPFDGMNEHGLTIGMAAVDPTPLSQDPAKPTIGSLRIIRLMLDQAKDTEEALALFGQYNIDFSGGPPIHYLIADRTGQSAVVELREGQVQILRTDQPWQAATNFYLNGASATMRQTDWRYHTVDTTLNQAGGALSIQTAMDLLAEVAQPHTRWSIVYGMNTGEVHVALSQRYEQIHQFHLPPSGE